MRKSPNLPLLLGLVLGSGVMAANVAAQETPANSAVLRPSVTRSEAPAASWLEKHRDRPRMVRTFVQRMPKGGDIHSHLSGAVYAENYLKWAADDGYCVDPAKVELIPPQDCSKSPTYFPAAELPKNTNTYDALVNRWSTRNLAFAGKSGHDQFFQAFAGFDLISSSAKRRDDMVAEVANRAASQYISYLELMITFQGSETRQLAKSMVWNGNFAEMRQQLIAKGLPELVTKAKQELDTLERETAATLNCDKPNAQPGCQVTIRFLQQTTRTRSPIEVFAQFVYAFELAKADSRVVGINLVAPEDHPVALRDYTLQMEMLKFLRSQSPEINISLHAGELTLGLVPPEQLRSHIRQAVEIAGAKRIGHGVDVLYEDGAIDLLNLMRERGVMVEICLTSNEVILNVAGKDHPFLAYLNAGVPMTLATDDEGISRIDLSHEYGLATLRYDLKYGDLKRLARNSLEHSFLPGKSLWQTGNFGAIVGDCQSDRMGAANPSGSCSRFLQLNPRAKAQWQLEADFGEFEALPWWR
jgi:hypothetical protein